MKTLQTIGLALLLSTFSSAYAGDSFDKVFSEIYEYFGPKNAQPKADSDYFKSLTKDELTTTPITYTFKESHDPGWMILVDNDGNEIIAEFFYEFISYEEIKKWSNGDKLYLVEDEELGVGLKRNNEGKLYKIIFSVHDHPINKINNNCSPNEQSTMGYTYCKDKETNFWRIENNYIYDYLLNTSDEEEKISLKKSQEAWVKYKDTHLETLKIFQKDAGTMSIMEWSSYVNMIYTDRYSLLIGLLPY
jgi:uncharacterized protein YecT (DUF1311 family)